MKAINQSHLASQSKKLTIQEKQPKAITIAPRSSKVRRTPSSFDFGESVWDYPVHFQVEFLFENLEESFGVRLS